MSKRPIYIGVDSGGTKTTGMSFDAEGTFIKAYTTVGANPYDIGLPKSQTIISDCVKQLCPEGTRVEKICIAVAGIGTVTNERLALWADSLGVQQSQLTIVGDAYVAHMGAFAGEDGILVLAGTGAILIARAQERIQRVGGWGHLLGDQGSGYGIALDALRQAVIDSDLERQSTLLKAMKEHYQVTNINELLRCLHNAPKSKIAAFSKRVLDLAARGDNDSCKVLQMHIEVFEQQLKFLQEQGFPPNVSYVGGLFQHDFYMQSFETMLNEIGCYFSPPRLKPVEAAAWVAMNKLELPKAFRMT